MKTPFVRKEDDSSPPEAPWGLPNRFPASKRGSSLRPLPLALSSVSPCLSPSLGRGSRAGLGCREHHCHRSVFSLGRCSLCFLWPLPKGPHSPRPGACPGGASFQSSGSWQRQLGLGFSPPLRLNTQHGARRLLQQVGELCRSGQCSILSAGARNP